MNIEKEKFKAKVSLYDVASHYTTIKTHGKLTYFLCPFHNDKHIGSAYFYNDRDKFICHSCGASGDVLTLLSGFTHIPLSETNELLEKGVSDLGINRDDVLRDRDSALPRNTHKYPLTETEHDLLFGPILKNEAYHQYSYREIRQMCKLNYSQYIKSVCQGSRIFYRKALSIIRQYESSPRSKEELWETVNALVLIEDTGLREHLKEIETSQIQDMKKFYLALISYPFDAIQFWKAYISTQLKLLKKALPEKAYLKEIAFRRKIFSSSKKE